MNVLPLIVWLKNRQIRLKATIFNRQSEQFQVYQAKFKPKTGTMQGWPVACALGLFLLILVGVLQCEPGTRF